MLHWKRSLTALALAAAMTLGTASPALAAEGGTPTGEPPAAGETPATGETAPEGGTLPEGEINTPSGMALRTDEHIAYLSGSRGRFRPDGELTRAEAAVILSRLLPHPVPALEVYGDVAWDAWYAQAVGMMAFLEAMGGEDGLFRPEDPVTRGDFIHALARFFPAGAAVPQFADVSPEDPNGADYLTARSLGWLTGFQDGSLRPAQSLTRAEAVTMVNRALGRVPDKAYIDANADPLLYLDTAREAWYYYDVMEASIPHGHTTASGGEAWTGHTPVDSGLASGLHLADGWLYCYDAERHNVVRGASVGSFAFDAGGHFTSGNADLDARLRSIVLRVTNDSMTQEQKLRALYVYTRDSFTYLRRPAYEFGQLDFMEKDALDMLTTGYGNCYSYASVFWYLSRWIGYDSRIYSGTVGTNKRPHSWVEINFDGTDYIFDTELEMAYHLKGRYEIDLYKYIDVDHWVYIK